MPIPWEAIQVEAPGVWQYIVAGREQGMSIDILYAQLKPTYPGISRETVREGARAADVMLGKVQTVMELAARRVVSGALAEYTPYKYPGEEAMITTFRAYSREKEEWVEKSIGVVGARSTLKGDWQEMTLEQIQRYHPDIDIETVEITDMTLYRTYKAPGE